MKLHKSVSILAIALAGLVSGAAQALPYSGGFNTGDIAAYDGFKSGLTGFDVFSNGSAAFYCASAGGCGIPGGGGIAFGAQVDPGGSPFQTKVGDIVRTVYQGVVNTFNPGIPTPRLDAPGQPGTYQLTVVADFLEFVALTTPVGVFAPISGGNFAIFYDTNTASFIDTAAQILSGNGYTDGTRIAHGTLDSSMSLPTTIVCALGNCSGSASVGGLLDSVKVGNTTNGAGAIVGFVPPPHDFLAATTIQFGPGLATGFQTQCFFGTGLAGAAGCSGTLNGFTAVSSTPSLTERADANIDFSIAPTVPEPASLALLGIGLAGLGAMRRRRRAD